MKKYKVSVGVGNVQGHLRYGHLEIELNEDELKEFNALKDADKADWLREGELVIDDYEVNDYGGFDLDDIVIEAKDV